MWHFEMFSEMISLVIALGSITSITRDWLIVSMVLVQCNLA